MTKVTVANNTNKKTLILDENTTLASAFEQADIACNGSASVSGTAIPKSAIATTTFAQLGYNGTPGRDSAFLLAVVDTKNA